MKLSIGNKIKALRRERGVTQEQLAASIGISFQAVSKWENDIALPDITLVPALASYFNISIDELFGFNLKEICEKQMKYAGKLINSGKQIPTKAGKFLRKACKNIPTVISC